ncbi:NAD(P)H-dependent oxidoreductase [Saxibacter everestensis]|uniref:NAD(P)H-dependent oxidoreductase n=1 Tax=Saxibacter everestensis TaxID=2909229 RepID=A0ABY8QUD6_9MICO|nr:NAD(P)H-dependent oxidoreductase [Brevibacteriaceae bacterium ZFBP1038]
MKVLWLFAHPEHRSLNGALRDVGLRSLKAHGHQYRESDLYAMGWNPVVTGADFGHDGVDRLRVAAASKGAYLDQTLSDEVLVEQEKLAWADTVVLQFPLWWYGMPAILKGWFDRVFVKGFGYGVIDRRTGRTLRYGEGKLAGRRAMIIVTAGAPEATIGPRGVNGDIDQLLFPLTHGTLWYSGITVLPPLVVSGADRLPDLEFTRVSQELERRLLSVPTAEPVPFRYQNCGDYDEDLVLRPDVARCETGLAAHIAGN